MKRKFLIANDLGLAKDEVFYLLDEMDSNGGELFGGEYKEALLEIANRLEQALENLGDED